MVAAEDFDPSKCFPHVGGPAGKLFMPLQHDYSTVILVAGGVGVTPLCSIWSEIACNRQKYARVKRCTVLWSFRSLQMVDAFKDYIALTQASQDGVVFDFRCFCTGKGQDERAFPELGNLEVGAVRGHSSM